MAYENLLVERDGGVLTITINRPKVLNALNAATLAELDQELAIARDDAAVKAIILTGGGEKSFVAGADINELAVQTPVGGREHARHGQSLFDRIEDLLAAPCMFLALDRRLHRELVDVGAGDERFFSRAREDHDAHAFILFELEDRAAQFVERPAVQRVEHLRTVDRDDRGRLVAFDQKILESHHNGNGYISQPSTTADARKPPNIIPPKRS